MSHVRNKPHEPNYWLHDEEIMAALSCLGLRDNVLIFAMDPNHSSMKDQNKIITHINGILDTYLNPGVEDPSSLTLHCILNKGNNHWIWGKATYQKNNVSIYVEDSLTITDKDKIITTLGTLFSNIQQSNFNIEKIDVKALAQQKDAWTCGYRAIAGLLSDYLKTNNIPPNETQRNIIDFKNTLQLRDNILKLVFDHEIAEIRDKIKKTKADIENKENVKSIVDKVNELARLLRLIHKTCDKYQLIYNEHLDLKNEEDEIINTLIDLHNKKRIDLIDAINNDKIIKNYVSTLKKVIEIIKLSPSEENRFDEKNNKFKNIMNEISKSEENFLNFMKNFTEAINEHIDEFSPEEKTELSELIAPYQFFAKNEKMRNLSKSSNDEHRLERLKLVINDEAIQNQYRICGFNAVCNDPFTLFMLKISSHKPWLFLNILKKYNELANSQASDFDSIIKMPAQRLMRYDTLLKEACNAISDIDHPLKKSITDLSQSANALAKQINDEIDALKKLEEEPSLISQEGAMSSLNKKIIKIADKINKKLYKILNDVSEIKNINFADKQLNELLAQIRGTIKYIELLTNNHKYENIYHVTHSIKNTVSNLMDSIKQYHGDNEKKIRDVAKNSLENMLDKLNKIEKGIIKKSRPNNNESSPEIIDQPLEDEYARLAAIEITRPSAVKNPTDNPSISQFHGAFFSTGHSAKSKAPKEEPTATYQAKEETAMTQQNEDAPVKLLASVTNLVSKAKEAHQSAENLRTELALLKKDIERISRP